MNELDMAGKQPQRMRPTGAVIPQLGANGRYGDIYLINFIRVSYEGFQHARLSSLSASGMDRNAQFS
jgi:hypothetical protein